MPLAQVIVAVKESCLRESRAKEHEGLIMNPTQSGTGSTAGGDGNPMSNPAINDKVDQAAQRGHEAVDKVADKTLTQLDRLSGTAHRAVNTAADAAASATQWASTLPDQARQAQAQLTEAACETIRARPLATMAGALFVGYLFAKMTSRRRNRYTDDN